MENTSAPERRTIAIDDLLAVEDYQIRRGTDAGTVRRYAGLLRAGVKLPPVKVGLIDGALVLLDGFHRVEAHRAARLMEIAVEITPTTAREARWLAAEANMAHGLPLRRSEIKEAFRAFIQAGRHLDERRRLLSLREVAQRCGAGSHNTVLSWLRKDFPSIARRYRSKNPSGGGLHGIAGPGFMEIAEGSIRAAVNAARGVTCERERSMLAVSLRDAAEEIERNAPPRVSEGAPGVAPEGQPAF